MSQKSRARDTEDAFTALELRIGHDFRDRTLLERALTHVSAVQGADAKLKSYQRLEFLGDRVLGLITAHLIYENMPEALEGDLARRFTDMVRLETCAEVALEWEIGDLIQLSKGEARSGGRKREAILGDACEAVIAAVYLDGGFPAAETVVRRAFGPRLARPEDKLKDPKTRLQEWAQGQGFPAPTYHEVSRSGPDHQPQFMIAARVKGFEDAEGSGASKRAAEQEAALAFLKRKNAEGAGNAA